MKGIKSDKSNDTKKDASVETPSSIQKTGNEKKQIITKNQPSQNFFTRFKQAYFGNKSFENKSSLESNVNSSQMAQSSPNETPKQNSTASKGGSFSFLKAVALLRNRKVVPVKKMTKEEIRKLFKRAYMSVLAVIRLNKICEDIRNYGTSPSLFDVAIRNRMAVKKVLFPLSFAITSAKKSPTDKIDFPLIAPSSKIIAIWNPILVNLLSLTFKPTLFKPLESIKKIQLQNNIKLSLIFYSASVLPYRIAFYDEITVGWEIFEFIVDGLFWLDLFINMFSTYYDDDNQLVKKRSVVIVSYLKSWFFIDFLSCLPIDLIAGAIIDQHSSDSSSTLSNSETKNTNYSNSQLKLLRLAKIPRLYRLIKLTKVIKMVRYFGRGDTNKVSSFIQINSGILRLINLFFLVFVVVHFFGCIWFYQAKIQDFSDETWVTRNELLGASSFTLYLYSIYFVFTTITTVGYGDIHAYANSEIIITLILIVIGVGFYSSTIGILSSVIKYMDSKQILLSRKVEIMNEYCNEMKIPNNVKKQLKQALQYTLDKNCFMWANQNKIFDELPMNLKFDICMNIYKGVMRTFSFFNLADDQSFVVRMVPQLRPLKLNPGDIIWNQRDVSDSLYLLSNGRVNYQKQVVEDIKTKERKSITFKTMINGSYFGEIDIIMDRKRRYRCQAETVCELYYITRQEYESIIRKEFPHIHQKLKKIAFDREKKNEEALKALKKLIRQAKEVADVQINVHTTNESPLKIPNLNVNRIIQGTQSLSNIPENIKSEFDHSIAKSFDVHDNKSPQSKKSINIETTQMKFQRAVHKLIFEQQNNRLYDGIKESEEQISEQQKLKREINILNDDKNKENDLRSISSSNDSSSSQNLSQSSHSSSSDNSKDKSFQDQDDESSGEQITSKDSQDNSKNSDNQDDYSNFDSQGEESYEKEQSGQDSNSNLDEFESSRDEDTGNNTSSQTSQQSYNKNNQKEQFYDKNKNSNKKTNQFNLKIKQTHSEDNSFEKDKPKENKYHKQNSHAKQKKSSSTNKNMNNSFIKYQSKQSSEFIFLKEELRKSHKKFEILEEKFKNLDSMLTNTINIAVSLQNQTK